MPVPSEIIVIVKRIDEELNSIERDTTNSLNLVQRLLSRFANNAILIQYFAYFNSILFFVESTKKQVQIIVDNISVEIIPSKIQEAGEDLGIILGRSIEAKVNVSRIRKRLESWQ
jgi:hypothetical protein